MGTLTSCIICIQLLLLFWRTSGVNIPETLQDFIRSSVENGAPNDKRYDWYAAGQDELSNTLERPVKLNLNKAKNAILIIGDGVGIATITAARIYEAQKSGKSGSDNLPAWDRLFPFTGLSRTHSAARQTTDSAGGGTALLCGEKVQDTTFGVSWNVTVNDCASANENKLTSTLDLAMEAGKSTGFVTTTRVTHATPGSSYAHISNRDWEGVIPDTHMKEGCKDVAAQLVEDNPQINVIFGGGRQHFLPDNVTDPEYSDQKGGRTDGQDLTQAWLDKKKNSGLQDSEYTYVWNKADFDNIDAKKVNYAFGLFEPGHMNYEADRSQDESGEPSLTEMVEKAIQILEKDEDGFFLLIESGRIDHAHHYNQANLALEGTRELNRAVAKVVEMVSDEDTLVVMTSDHSHSFFLTGYATIDSDITGLSDAYESDPLEFITDRDPSLAQDMKPYTITGYFNGPGYFEHRWNTDTNSEIPRKDITNDNYKGMKYVQDAPVPMKYSTHGGEDVAIFAKGPWAHLFSGSHEESYVHHAFTYAMCTGKGKKMCDADSPRDDSFTCTASSLAPVTAIVVMCLLNLLL